MYLICNLRIVSLHPGFSSLYIIKYKTTQYNNRLYINKTISRTDSRLKLNLSYFITLEFANKIADAL